MIGIYKITSPSNKIYIGQTINYEKRIKKYKSLECKKQTVLYRSFLKYGVENHQFEIIEECDIKELNEKERYYQDYYDVLNIGLNCKLTNTDDKSGKLSEETKLKISKGLKLSKRIYKSLSEESIQKMINTRNKNSLNKIYKRKIKNGLNTKFKKNETNKYVCKKVINTDTNIVYNSVKEVSEIFNINYYTLLGKLNPNKTYHKNNTTFKYL